MSTKLVYLRCIGHRSILAKNILMRGRYAGIMGFVAVFQLELCTGVRPHV